MLGLIDQESGNAVEFIENLNQKLVCSLDIDASNFPLKLFTTIPDAKLWINPELINDGKSRFRYRRFEYNGGYLFYITSNFSRLFGTIYLVGENSYCEYRLVDFD